MPSDSSMDRKATGKVETNDESVGYNVRCSNSSSIGHRVLVLLASHNGSNWIAEQISSIVTQKCVQVSILVRDDCSTDDTLEIVRKIIAEDSRVSLVADNGCTGSAAQNFFSLIAEASADNFDYIAFADQDDIWFPDKLINGIEQLLATNGAGYSSATVAQWSNGRKRIIRLDKPQSKSDFLFEGAGQGCTFLLTHALYDRIRDFIKNNRPLLAQIHFHDWTMYALTRSWNARWVFDSLPSMIYRQHTSNDTGARSSATGIRTRLLKIRSGWYAEQLKLVSKICALAAPESALVSTWMNLLNAPKGIFRTFNLIRFCFTSGRRSAIDKMVLVFACICQWI